MHVFALLLRVMNLGILLIFFMAMVVINKMDGRGCNVETVEA